MNPLPPIRMFLLLLFIEFPLSKALFIVYSEHEPKTNSDSESHFQPHFFRFPFKRRLFEPSRTDIPESRRTDPLRNRSTLGGAAGEGLGNTGNRKKRFDQLGYIAFPCFTQRSQAIQSNVSSGRRHVDDLGFS